MKRYVEQNNQAAGSETEYTGERLRKERMYGLFWYSWLWNILRPLALALCVLLVVTGVVMAGWNWVDRHYFAAVDPNDPAPVAFSVASGSSLTRVANSLEAENLIRSRTVFKYYGDFLGYGQKIQAGDYQVSRNMTMREIMELLTTGDGRPLTRNITIIPGWTVREIAQYLKEEGVIGEEETFLSLCRGGQAFSAYYYIADALNGKNAAQRLYMLEGYLAPDTYEIYTSASAEDIIKKLLSQTEAVFPAEYHSRAEEIGMTMDQVMTLASMIEKEAKTDDFARVSAVFHNRLQANMSLDSDVTVKYVTGVKRLRLTESDLNVSSPYNTYKNRGLPPGPICSPSAAAIRAALYPDEQMVGEHYLYFCAKEPGSGELYFSRTLEEHSLAVSIYAPLWQAYDQEHGL